MSNSISASSSFRSPFHLNTLLTYFLIQNIVVLMRCVTFIKISYNVTNLMLKISRIPVYSVFALDSFHCIIKCSGLSQYIKVNTPGLNRSVKCLFCHQSCHIQSHIFNIYLPGFVNDWMTNRAKSHTLYMFGIYTSINWSITMNLRRSLQAPIVKRPKFQNFGYLLL
jgi:hypothetical protein